MKDHNDLTFFTNEADRNLYERFNKILKSNTQFFDVLVGYFRTSGFYLMYPALTDVEKIRILVGLNVDKKTVEMIQEADKQLKVNVVSQKTANEQFGQSLENEFKHSEDSYNIEKSIEFFIEWIKSGKLEMRMYIEEPIHAKVYIMRKDMEKVPDQFGSIITGSSNFSMAGLKNNLEFNVELKDSRDVEFALEKFEEIWGKSVDITEKYIATVQTKTWLRSNISPYEIYLKMLYEFFKDRISVDKKALKTGELPEEFMELEYQRDAVKQALRILETYSGVFLSDVVGLGKTFIAALLAKELKKQGKILIICPPTLTDYWNDVMEDFDIGARVRSMGKLESILEEGISKYKYVFVDEAHRFRNEETYNFSLLHEICYGKKVILISATPQNNYATDILSQISLFQPKHNCSIIPENKNIEAFFKKLEVKLKKVKDDSEQYQQQLKQNSEIIRDKVLRQVMVRRTRNEIMSTYGEDLVKQGLVFPKVAAPEKIIYEFDEEIESVFNYTINTIKTLNYARYMPLIFHKDEKKYATLRVSQKNMSGFMKSMLVKRLESSFYAFKKTLDRFIDSHERFMSMVEKGVIYISKKVNVYDLMDVEDDDSVFGTVDIDKNMKLEQLVKEGRVQKFKVEEFRGEFFDKVKHDLTMLRQLKKEWGDILRDPKSEQFITQIKENILLKDKQIVIFTESKETAYYVGNMLQENYPNEVAVFSSQSSKKNKMDIKLNFDQRIEKENQKNDIKILITTDVLAEGINLHRANIIINYDLPWNPSRIMQRVGRVNRVGSVHEAIYVFNIFPTSQAKVHLSLEDNIKFKLQAFNDTLGEDLRYLSESEEISSHNLYEILNSKESLEGEENVIDPELKYLKKIRDIRDNDPEFFESIKHIPLKAKTARSDKRLKDATLSFIKKGSGQYFFLTKEGSTTELNFIEAIKYIEAISTEKAYLTPENYYWQLNKNKQAFDNKMNEDNDREYESIGKITGNDKKIRDTLLAVSMNKKFTEDEENNLNRMIGLFEKGIIPKNISKQIALSLKVNEETDLIKVYYHILKQIPLRYLGQGESLQSNQTTQRQVILSEYFLGEEN